MSSQEAVQPAWSSCAVPAMRRWPASWSSASWVGMAGRKCVLVGRTFATRSPSFVGRSSSSRPTQSPLPDIGNIQAAICPTVPAADFRSFIRYVYIPGFLGTFLLPQRKSICLNEYDMFAVSHSPCFSGRRRGQLPSAIPEQQPHHPPRHNPPIRRRNGRVPYLRQLPLQDVLKGENPLPPS